MTKSKIFVAVSLLLYSANHILSATLSGQVIVWGRNALGQGDATAATESWAGPVRFAGISTSDATVVAAGMSHAIVLLTDGTVAGSGFNYYGQAVGWKSANSDSTNGPVQIAGSVLSDVVSVAAGDYFSLALKGNGNVVAWGGSGQGEAQVPSGLSNVVAIAAGQFHALALKRDGTVVSWGDRKNSFQGLSNIVAVAASKSWFWNDVALRTDGRVIEWFGAHVEVVPLQSTNVASVSAGYNHSLALMNDGTAFAWGANGEGQALGTPTLGGNHSVCGKVIVGGLALSNIVAIAAGHEYSLAIRRDGTVVEWGKKGSYLGVPGNLTNVFAIAAGDDFCLAIRKP